MTDPLLAWRDRFPALEQCVHLISHSLGCVPARAEEDLFRRRIRLSRWEKIGAVARGLLFPPSILRVPR